jgi:hypothetical protein
VETRTHSIVVYRLYPIKKNKIKKQNKNKEINPSINKHYPGWGKGEGEQSERAVVAG